MNISDLINNVKTNKQIDKVQNVLGLYSLTRDINLMIGELFLLSEDEDFLYFFEKYDDFENINDINIEDFPIEKLMVESLRIYNIIKDDKFDITKNVVFPEHYSSQEKIDELKENIISAFIKCFETELEELKQIKNTKLKEFKISFLNKKMQKFISVEAYENAALIRDQIKELT
jgi:hypothetical protein